MASIDEDKLHNELLSLADKFKKKGGMKLKELKAKENFGKWEKCEDTPSKVKCSKCGYKHKWVVTICPNCGADMRIK